MADIQRYLNAIMAAVLGEQVRGSIHDAIDIINKVGEKQLNCGNAINDGDPAGDAYDGSLYINTTTDELLRCNGTTWVKVGGIRGNGISEITGPDTTGLDDEYTIHYTDGAIVKFTVHNGRGIDRVTGPVSNGLIDTYTIVYNDGTDYSFSIKNGNQWYYGMAITGGSSTATAFVLPFAVKSGDAYLNISTDEVYTCAVGAAAGDTSMWEYKLTISSAATGTNNYAMLINQPFINGTQLLAGSHTGNDFGLQNLADADEWLMNNTVTPPVVLVKSMPLNSTKITFSASEMSDINTNGWACKPYFQCDDGQAVPALKKIIHNADGTLDITYTKVKAIQGTVTCKLRIVK